MQRATDQHAEDHGASREEPGLVIDCDRCAMQHTSACDDCVVSVLLSTGDLPVELSEAESSALDALAGEGLVPRLRLLPRDGGAAAAAG